MVKDAGESEGCFSGAAAAMRPAEPLPAEPLPAEPLPAEPLLVLKFGSSVLRSTADLPRVAGEIYRQRRRGLALVAGARGGATIAYSAAVGGGVPMLETIARVRAGGGSIVRAWGLLNGTVNAILTGMARGQDLAAALARAQAAGFAEEDSSADLSGADAAAKLRILARAAFEGAEPEIAVEALDDAAAARIAASGERWVQVAELSQDGGVVSGRVRLAPLASLGVAGLPEDEWNCLFLELADGRQVSCTGRGAGGAATAEAIVADLYDLAARGRGSEAIQDRGHHGVPAWIAASPSAPRNDEECPSSRAQRGDPGSWPPEGSGLDCHPSTPLRTGVAFGSSQ